VTKKKYRVLQADRFQGKQEGDTVELDLSAAAEQRYLDSGLVEAADETTTSSTETTKEG
jgi:hypothetical protein